MLETVLPLHIFVENIFFFQNCLMNGKLKNSIFYNIINLFNITFDQFNVLFLNTKLRLCKD